MKFISTNAFINLFKKKEPKKKIVVTQPNELMKQMELDIVEYNLIREKKSNISRKQRDLVLARIDAYIALEYIKYDEGNAE